MSVATLVDEFLPVYDVSDEVATVVEADAQTTWDALIDADLIDVGRKRPLIALLGGVRILPDLVWQRLHGEHPPAAPERLSLRDTTKLPISGGGWVLLGERAPDEIALGLVGKFWRPVIEFADVDAGAFRDWSEPGFAKTIYRARHTPPEGRADAAVGGDADGHHRRARPRLVPALLDVRSRLRRSPAGPRTARCRARAGRASHRLYVQRLRALRLYRVKLTGKADSGGCCHGTGYAIIALHRGSIVCWRFAHLHGFFNATEPRFTSERTAGQGTCSSSVDRAETSPSRLCSSACPDHRSNRALSVQLLRECAQPAVSVRCRNGTL